MAAAQFPGTEGSWIMAEILRSARLAAGCSVSEAAARLGSSRWKINRIEHDENPATPRDAYDLLLLYGWSVERAAATTGYDRPTHEGDAYRDAIYAIPPGLRLYLEYENAATAINQYHRDAQPGLLQTRDYAQAWSRHLAPTSPEKTALWESVRAERQRRFIERQPETHLILDEAALYRGLLSGDAYIDQIDRVSEFAVHPWVRMQIMPLGCGLVPGMESSFTAFKLPPEAQADSVVATYRLDSAAFLEQPTEQQVYEDRFDRLSDAALPPPESLALLEDIRRRQYAAR